jgi:DNA-binding MarR family transcriptional regulator
MHGRRPATGGPILVRPVTSVARFDEIIHPSTRLSIVSLLAAVDWVDFSFVRDRLGLSDSALSKQFATLEEAGYIAIERPVTDRRRRVRVSLTAPGREAFQGHVAALRQIVAAADPSTVPL